MAAAPSTLLADAPSQTLRSCDFEGTECTLPWRRSTPSIPSLRPASYSPLAIGAVIGDRYRVGNKVASGGMGEVWEGEHLTIGMKVAIKAMLSCGHDVEELSVRFAREAQLLARVRSDYVTRVVDFVHDTRFGPLLIMEFIEGPSLADVLRGRSLTVEDAVDLGIDIARALCELHRVRIVHRDIKPQNVILQPISQDRTRAVIVDFGVSRVLTRSDDKEQTSITQDDLAVGTMEYMPPEQILRSNGVTEAADQYALGALLFRAATGKHLFADLQGAALARVKLTRPTPPVELSRSDRLAQAFEQILKRALQADPNDRYPSIAALLAELSKLGSAKVSRPSLLSWPPRWASLSTAAIFSTLLALSAASYLGCSPIHEAKASSAAP